MSNQNLVGHLVLPNTVLSGKIVFDSTIVGIEEEQVSIDAPYIFPAFIDIHTHGCHGYSVMDGNTESILEMAKAKAAQGVSHFLPTTLSSTHERILKTLESIKDARYFQQDNFHSHLQQAEIVGIHLEGPYLSLTKYKGSQNPEFIRTPNKAEFTRYNNMAENLIKIVTLAPEIDGGIEFIKFICSLGIRASIGHTAALEKDCNLAFQSGARAVTHMYNGMRELNHYNLGAVGSALIHDEIYCEVIADGHHMTFGALEIVLRCKPKNKIMCITDSTYYSGMPDGEYNSENLSITVKNGVARTSVAGGLAGSLVKMDEILKNLVNNFYRAKYPLQKLELHEIGRMLSQNQAEYLGLSHIGKIEKGFFANFAVLDSQFNLIKTIHNGKIIYSRE